MPSARSRDEYQPTVQETEGGTGYEVGTCSSIDLLPTATNYVRAEQDYPVAFYNQVIARVQLKAASGPINMADLQAISQGVFDA